MIAIAGTIGTGLFLGSGSALAQGGPVGCFLGYLIMGTFIGLMMYCLVSDLESYWLRPAAFQRSMSACIADVAG